MTLTTNTSPFPGDGGWCSPPTVTTNTSAGLRELSISVRPATNESGEALWRMERAESCSLGDSSPAITELICLDLKREVRAVSIREMLKSDPEKAMKIFDQCYELYVKAFPDPNEIQSPGILLRALKRESRLWDMIAVVEGDRVLGARHMILLQSNHSEIGAFIADEHVYVDQSERKRGIGRMLITHTEAIMRSWGAKLAINEQNDPNAMSPELLSLDAQSGISPQQRLQFWKKRGYEGVDAPYVQPPLEEGKDAVHYLRVAIRRLDSSFPNSLPTEGYIQMLKAYQSSWVHDIDNNPIVTAYWDAIRREHPQRVPILDLEEPRTCVKRDKGE